MMRAVTGWGPRFALTGIVACAIALTGCPEDPPPPPPPKPVVVAPPPPPEPEPELPAAIVVVRIGKVEIRRKERTDWDPLEVGDKISAEDAVRTAENSSMELSVDAVRMKVRERSEVMLKKVARNSLSARARGQIESDFAEGKGEVELEAEGSDAVVRSQGGHFLMTSDGQGVVAVAAVRGVVNLAAAGKEVSVGAGKVSHVRPKGKPEAPRDALRSVLLHVNWPGRETRDARVAISGKVEAGSRLVVQGAPVRPDAKGNFKTRIRLRPGKQRVTVAVTDPLGRSSRKDSEILVDRNIDVNKEGTLWR